MTVVIAVGGNALLRRGESLDIGVQRGNVERAAAAIADAARRDWVVVTHGNGPQVGLLALQSEAYHGTAPYPMDVLGAESEGMIGYLLEQELGRRRSPDLIATLLTQVVVDPHDPAFAHPTKPVGPLLDEATGTRLARERGWAIAPDTGGVRRVVPSPAPVAIVELNAIRLLLWSGVLVICAGGGGIPVVPEPGGGFRGVEAVIDKDLSAALLATKLGADALLLVTDVDAVYDDFGTKDARAIRCAEPAELRSLDLPAGSMRPKVEAACRFVEEGRGTATIGHLDEMAAMLAGTAGTRVAGSPASRSLRVQQRYPSQPGEEPSGRHRGDEEDRAHPRER